MQREKGKEGSVHFMKTYSRERAGVSTGRAITIGSEHNRCLNDLRSLGLRMHATYKGERCDLGRRKGRCLCKLQQNAFGELPGEIGQEIVHQAGGIGAFTFFKVVESGAKDWAGVVQVRPKIGGGGSESWWN